MLAGVAIVPRIDLAAKSSVHAASQTEMGTMLLGKRRRYCTPLQRHAANLGIASRESETSFLG